MADPFITNKETLAYGEFAVGQIIELVIGLDPENDPTLELAATRIKIATDAMRAALEKAGSIEVVTYAAGAAAGSDPIAAGRDVLRRLVKYAESRPKGDVIADEILGGETMTTVLRRRPVKLAGSLGKAIEAVAKHKDALPEHATWTADLIAARDAITKLNTDVRASRAEKRDATPEVEAARAEWFRAYGSAKLIVEGILKWAGKVRLMPEVFDDLAEVHRAQGVSDEDGVKGGEGAKPA